MDIYDQKKHQWYRVARGIFGLHLVKINYTYITRLPCNGDLIYDDQLKTINNPQET